MILRLVKAVLAILLVLFGGIFAWNRYQLGQFKTLGPSTPLPVRYVSLEDGAMLRAAEDVAVDRIARRAYFSVFDRQAARQGENPGGHLFVMALDDPGLVAHDITPPGLKVFHPHGLDLFRDDSGALWLYVVNHPGAFDDLVEIFQVSADGTVTHRETIADSEFVSLNDLTVVAPRRFYVTNDHGHRTGLRRQVEDFVHTPESSIVYFDGSVGQRVVSGLTFANGIAASLGGGEIFVAETLAKAVRVYRRDAGTGNLTLMRTLGVDTGVDNLSVDPEGHLWAAAHPQLYKAFRFARNPKKPSPSEILTIDFAKPSASAVNVVFRDDGTRVSASSGVVHVGDSLLIASVFGPAAVVALPAGDAAGRP